MKILIIAGGTGSIALQQGIYENLESKVDGVDVKVLVNAYDNGLSTGAVRRVMSGKILGPSDVRKNQTTRLSFENPQSPWLKFLDVRFSAQTEKVQDLVLEHLQTLESALGTVKLQKVRSGIRTYFSKPSALKIDYNDFSLANIVYAGIAAEHGNSLREAARIMAGLMGIKDNVILNDDTSLFLAAHTKSGVMLSDEADIVSWGNATDGIERISFTDENGNSLTPVLCDEAANAILAADLIICSSGTQWSSLIPTYASRGFSNTIDLAQGKIVMVMNRSPDKDSPGQTADDIVRIVSNYIPIKKLHVLIDKQADLTMRTLGDISKEVGSVTYAQMGFTPGRHSPIYLYRGIGHAYFGDAIKSAHFMFDYDDTLVGRGNKFQKASDFNRKTLIDSFESAFSVCTGNSIKNIFFSSASHDTKIRVFAEYGANEYFLSTCHRDDDSGIQFVRTLNKYAAMSVDTINRIISTLVNVGVPRHKIENRGNVVIAIRPIDEEYREVVFRAAEQFLESAFKSEDSSPIVQKTGRSTIEISMMQLQKKHAVAQMILELKGKQLAYIGDEGALGNDADVFEIQSPLLKCVNVSSVAETSFFISLISGVNHLE